MYEFNYKVVVEAEDPEQSDDDGGPDDLGELGDNTLEVLEQLMGGNDVDLEEHDVMKVRVFGPVTINDENGKLLKENHHTETFRIEREG